MQIVIDIPYGHYLTIKDGFLNECIKSTTEAIVNGTILPKGHGRIVDIGRYEGKVIASRKYCGVNKLIEIAELDTIIEADRVRDCENK